MCKVQVFFSFNPCRQIEYYVTRCFMSLLTGRNTGAHTDNCFQVFTDPQLHYTL